MKILMIAPEPFFQPRGTPISVYQRLLALASNGHQIDLLTYHIGEYVDIPGVIIHRIPKLPFIKSIKPGPSWAKLFLDPLLFFKAIILLVINQYDVIHSHEEASFFAALLAKIFGLKHLYDMHSSLPIQLKSFRYWNNFLFIGIFKAFEKMVLRSSDAIITIGSDLDEWVKETCPTANTIKIENLPLQTIFPVPGPGTIENIRQNLGLNGKHTIVYTGTFEPYQGLDMLINSAQIVVSECREVSFLLIGGNESQIDYYRHLASKRNLLEFFHFTGKVPITEATAYLDIASILVSPRLDGTSVPLKVYTYLSSGKPMVATNTVAHRQALSEDIAVLTTPNEEGFAQGILTLIGDPQLGLCLGKRARNFALDKYGSDSYRKKLEFIYQTLESDQSSLLRPNPFGENQ
jgi:glycosyltransferase involved in cell wall biosynthesis